MIRLTSATLLPPIDHVAGVTPRLVAMAKPPRWVIDITNGRARHAYAEGLEVGLMDAFLTELRGIERATVVVDPDDDRRKHLHSFFNSEDSPQ